MSNQVSHSFSRLVTLLSVGLFTVVASGCQPKPVELPEVLDEILGEEISLEPTTQAGEVNFQDVSGQAVVDSFNGEVQVTVSLPDGVVLPDGAVLEAWLVDAGRSGGPGESSVSDQDERFGISFGKPRLDQMLDNAPYALSLGTLIEEKGKWVRRADFGGELTPYDQVMITLETDGSIENYDPRPGMPILTGEIKGEDLEDLLDED